MKSVLVRAFSIPVIFLLSFGGQSMAQCTLAIDSAVSTNVTCNGQSNGTITVYSHGAQGSVSYASGTGSSILSTQTFDASSAFNSTGSSTTKWWSVNSCNGFSQITWHSTGGCSGGSGGGAVGYTTSPGAYNGCFLVSPLLNCTGLNSVVITFDLTNSQSLLGDSIYFYIWSNVSNRYYPSSVGASPSVVSTINGVAATHILFDVARNCQTMTVTFDLTSIPAGNRSSLYFYLNPYFREVSGTSFNVLFDNMSISQGAPSQSSNVYSGLAPGTYTITVTDSAGCTASTSAITITQPAALTVGTSSISPTTVGGNNGSATATPSGGTSPYTYVWNTAPTQTTATASNLTAGTYSVTVTDAHNCTATASVTVSPHSCAGLGFTSVTSTNVSCNGLATGSITVAGTGGTAPYQYYLNSNPAQSSGSFPSLTAGTYSVHLIDNAGCTATYSNTVTVTQPAVLAVNVTTTNATTQGGNDGTATANVTGGTMPYSYNWSNGANTNPITGLISGTYCVTITDNNGCTATACGTVSQPSCNGFSISTVSPLNVTCHGAGDGIISVAATGGTTPYQYQLNSGSYQSSGSFSNLVAGSYTVTAKDASGCTYTYPSTVVLTEPNVLAVNVTTTNVTTVGGNNGTATAHVTGGTSAYTYQWGNMATTNSITNLNAGTYCVTVTDANFCSATACGTVTQPSCPGFTVTAQADSVACHGGNNGSITVTATGGASPYQYQLNSGSFQSSNTFTGLAAGSYTINVKDTNQCTGTVSVTVLEPAALTLSFYKVDATTSTAQDGYDSAIVHGGGSPYLYQWSTGDTTIALSSVTHGVYCVTVTNINGCTVSGCDTIGIGNTTGCNGFVLDSVKPINITCNGAGNGTINIYSHGGTGIILYSINNGGNFQTANSFTNLAAGSYYVQTRDASNCVVNYVNNPVIIAEPSAVAPIATLSGNTLGTGAYSTYQWYYNGVSIGATATSQTYTATQSGNYYVVVTDANGCTGSSNVVPVTISGINQVQQSLLSIAIFPNPFSDAVNVVIDGYKGTSDIQVELFDLFGRKLYESTQATGQFSINTSELAQGIYIIRFKADGQLTYRQVVKE